MMAKVTVVGLQVLGSRFAELAGEGVLIQALYPQARRIWARAAHAFVREALRHVLVETGMTAATFWPLSRAISNLRAGVPGTPGLVQAEVSRARVGKRQDLAEFPRGHRRSPPRSRSANDGERAGRKAFSLTFGTPRRPRFRFFFQTAIFHFALKEAQARNLGGVRESALAAGERAFLEVIDRELTTELGRYLGLLLNGRVAPRSDLAPNNPVGRVDTLGEDA